MAPAPRDWTPPAAAERRDQGAFRHSAPAPAAVPPLRARVRRAPARAVDTAISFNPRRIKHPRRTGARHDGEVELGKDAVALVRPQAQDSLTDDLRPSAPQAQCLRWLCARQQAHRREADADLQGHVPKLLRHVQALLGASDALQLRTLSRDRPKAQQRFFAAHSLAEGVADGGAAAPQRWHLSAGRGPAAAEPTLA